MQVDEVHTEDQVPQQEWNGPIRENKSDYDNRVDWSGDGNEGFPVTPCWNAASFRPYSALPDEESSSDPLATCWRVVVLKAERIGRGMELDAVSVRRTAMQQPRTNHNVGINIEAFRASPSRKTRTTQWPWKPRG